MVHSFSEVAEFRISILAFAPASGQAGHLHFDFRSPTSSTNPPSTQQRWSPQRSMCQLSRSTPRASAVTRVTGSCAWTQAGESQRVSTTESADVSRARLPCQRCVENGLESRELGEKYERGVHGWTLGDMSGQRGRIAGQMLIEFCAHRSDMVTTARPAT